MAALTMGEERTRPRQPKPPEPLSAEEVLLLTRTDRVDGPLADRAHTGHNPLYALVKKASSVWESNEP
jgi:hypothetical protein